MLRYRNPTQDDLMSAFNAIAGQFGRAARDGYVGALDRDPRHVAAILAESIGLTLEAALAEAAEVRK